MSREKQIEEIAEVLCGHFGTEHCEVCDHRKRCFVRLEAEWIYGSGYRKQIEGEWKQTTEPLGAYDVDCVECSACGESWVLDEDFDYDVVKDFWNFCPHCGAKMKGGAE